MQFLSLGGFALPLLWKVAQVLCQVLWRDFYRFQAVKAHCTGSAQHLGLDLRDLHDPYVQPVRPLAYTGATVQGTQTSGGSGNPETPPNNLRNAAPHQKQTPCWLYIILGSRSPSTWQFLCVVFKYRWGNEHWSLWLYAIRCFYWISALWNFPFQLQEEETQEQVIFTFLLCLPGRFIFFTWGFICQSKYIKSNIGFDQDGPWRENDTFSQYFVDQKKLNNGCNFSSIRSK